MPLWLDMLKTPMAAPETPRLKTMRRTFQALCILCALTSAARIVAASSAAAA